MVSIYSLPSHTLHIRCPIPVVQRTANQITSPYPSKKAKRYLLLPYHPPRITQYQEILVPEATDSKEVTDHQKLSFRTIFPDFHSVRRKVTFRMSDMIPSYINIHPFCNGFSVTCHFPIWQVWQPVFFNTSGRSRTPGSRAVRLGYLQSIKRDTQPLGSPRYSCHTDLSDRQFVRPLVFDILRKSRQFPYRAPSARLRF